MQHSKAENCAYRDKGTCIVEPYNATRLPIMQFWAKRVRSSRSHVRVTTPTHVERGLKHCKHYGFPIQTYGKTSKCHNFNSEAWINNPRRQTSSFDPFCVHIIYKLCPEVLTNPPRIRLFNYLFKYTYFSFRNDSSKVEKYRQTHHNLLVHTHTRAGATNQRGNGRQKYNLNVSRKWSSVIQAHNLI